MAWTVEPALDVRLFILWKINTLLSSIKTGPEESRYAENVEKTTISSIETIRRKKS